MIPRNYQLAGIEFCVASLSAQRRCFVQLPTGTGKSLLLLLVAKAWRRMGKPVYVIAPTDQAVEQLHATARRLGMFAVLDTRLKRAPLSAPLVITTYSCAWRRYRSRLKINTLCLLDECHHINFKAPINSKILTSFQSAIGLSATPWSKGCADYFGKSAYTYRLSQAIADGVISPFEILPWQEPTMGRYQIIYTNSGEYRAQLVKDIRHSDYAVYQRASAQAVIGRFRRGTIGTIIVNRMLTEGFDLPQIKNLWIARDSRSRIAVMQMAGRALRPFQNQKARIYPLNARVHSLLRQAIKKAG